MRNFKITPNLYPEISITHATGVNLYDSDNKKYIDLSGSAGMCCLGYSNKEIGHVIKNQIDILAVVPHNYRTNERNNLAKKIISLFPACYNSVTPTVTGSETIEAAMQIAIQKTGVKKFLSFNCAYHGRTIGSGSLGEGKGGLNLLKSFFEVIDPPIKSPQIKKSLEIIEKKFQQKKFAAFIVEGVITNGGYIMPPSGFYQKILALCHEYGVLLIFDEVLTGFGRTGKMFSFEHHGVLPDMICVSKAIAAGYSAMGAIISKDDLANNYEGYSSFTWTPLGCAIAIKNIEIIKNKKLVERSRTLGKESLIFLNKYLHKCPLIQDINGIGLGIALKFNNSFDAQNVYLECLKNGVVIFKKLDVNLLTIQPALIIEKKELQKAIKKVVIAVIRVYRNKQKYND